MVTIRWNMMILRIMDDDEGHSYENKSVLFLEGRKEEKRMKYQCLILDHDDTVVDSTRQIHYPCFVEYMRQWNPSFSLSFEEYMWKNFHPGLLEYLTDELGFTAEDMEDEMQFWVEYVKKHIPDAYPGISEVLQSYHAQGGKIVVISHSMSKNIERDYAANHLPKPDLIFGWERPEKERKPHPFPVEETMRLLQLPKEALLMVDDLKPGLDMARKVGIDFAAAGWAYELPEIHAYMEKNADYYLPDITALKHVLELS